VLPASSALAQQINHKSPFAICEPWWSAVGMVSGFNEAYHFGSDQMDQNTAKLTGKFPERNLAANP